MLDRINIFLLTENRLVREALTRIFGHHANLHVAAATSLSPELVSEILASGANILVTDPSANILSALEIIPELRRVAPELRVVLISMEPDPATLFRAVRAGVLGYVLKDASCVDVAKAVRAVAADEAICPPSLCTHLFKYVAQQSFGLKKQSAVRPPRHFGLTRHEQQLMGMIKQGLTNQEIADRLNLSEPTVANRVNTLLKKVGTTDRLEAAQFLAVTNEAFRN